MIEIFKGFVLFLFVDGSPIEYTPKESLCHLASLARGGTHEGTSATTGLDPAGTPTRAP